MEKLKIIGSCLLLMTMLAGCADQGEMDWASAQDPTQGDLGDGGKRTNPPDEPPAQEPPPVSTPNPSLIFATDGRHYTLAHNEALRWDGCSSTALARGGYESDTSCGHAFLYDGFVDHLNRYFFTCIESAARQANLPQPRRLFVNHLGSYNDRDARNSDRLSMHAYARALDIQKFNLIDSRGNVTRISANISAFKGATAVFYDGFRSCWMHSMPSRCVPGQLEYQGSIGHTKSKVSGTNSLHNDHIHLSFPPCAGA